ncbi:MAG: DNA polymerase III subunit alpha [Bacteroidetes bacterium]|nr:DNA polymerase III subunit alpha [Bacteroidota bacterium]
MPDFTHLHVHTQYSILDGAASIKGLLSRAKEFDMKALAITDHGNLYGVLNFCVKAREQGIKPIIGCEMYVARRGCQNRSGKVDRSGYHLILLARNLTGYKNLSRLSSLGYKRENFYYTPRIDKDLLRQYHEGLIASSACLGGEIASAILEQDEHKAENALKEYIDIFGGDFYLELMDHGLPEQKTVNTALIRLAKKHGVKVIATNDVHFIHSEDFEAHHILICLNTGKDADSEDSMHYTGNEFLRSSDEMAELFRDMPEALANTMEVVGKIENFDITTDKVILPRFPLPPDFKTQDEYLRHLTYEGARKRYAVVTEEIKQRLDFELEVISKMDYPGYFLIVQDFINAARERGVIVGPGRGSAAGSAVAFCTGITNIDPIKYNLLFERFLNPERVSMPDIDIDFDDEGREQVLKYVVGKYGEEKVAQIVTFGTMAARLAIRDVGRVLKLPLDETDRLAKLVPDKPGTSLNRAYREVPELENIKRNGPELARKTLVFAEILEGSTRHTGTHACGVIIGPDNLMEYIPLATAKDSSLMVTQYEGKMVEQVGMLKMDFLGLKTLSIIRDAVDNVYKRHGIRIDIENLALNDKKTFELYQHGETIGTFQFESDGMRGYLRELKPTDFEDLIAMNALYRPGPMEFIKNYIRRKYNIEKTVYPHPLLEGILKPTYGIMVYQEQIMQAAQVIAGFSLAKADLLRRAMGKKQKDVMEQQRADFVEGASHKGIDEQKASEVFSIIQEFANYGFNRSHSAAYSVIAYQTAYLKAHYPAEYMAAVLTHNLSDIKKITYFIDECKRQQISVLGPDINESDMKFVVNKKGEIRFGLAAIKGIGETAVEHIIEERDKNGPFSDIFDLALRVNLRSVNKRCIEALAKAGAFDSFAGTHRAQYFFHEDGEETTFLEKVIRHAADFQYKQNSSQVSLFGEDVAVSGPSIQLPSCEPWTKMDIIKNEKEVTGFYMSGHPLDDFRVEIHNFCNVEIADFKDKLPEFKSRGELSFCGIVTEVTQRTSQKGNPFGIFIIEDYNDSIKLHLFSEDYLKMKHLLVPGTALLAKTKIEPRYDSETLLGIRTSSLYLLSEVLDRFTNQVTLLLNLSEITSERIDQISELIKKHKGKCPLKFLITDPDENLSVEMLSPKLKILVSDFISEIRQMPEFSFKIN